MKPNTQSATKRVPVRAPRPVVSQQPHGRGGCCPDKAGLSSVTTFDQSQGTEYPTLTNLQVGEGRFGSLGTAACLRPRDVLALLPVSKSTLWRWVRCGRLTAFKLGPRITVFSREEVMDVFFSEVAR